MSEAIAHIGYPLLLEAAARTGLSTPLEALLPLSPALGAALIAAATFLSDFPLTPAGVPILDDTLTAVLAAYFGDAPSERVAASRLLDHASAIYLLRIHAGDQCWDPVADPGLALWRKGRAALVQRPERSVTFLGLPARRALAARLFDPTVPVRHVPMLTPVPANSP